ncbi:17602_t:CDS:2 [Entrophospora sp. SA101]|nr:17602_t:CDS:2 [Entrophospora sp. SA101]
MVDSAERISRWNRLEKQAVRKIFIYILNFVKWLPIVPFGIDTMTKYEDFLRDLKSEPFVSLENFSNNDNNSECQSQPKKHQSGDDDNSDNILGQESKEEQEKLQEQTCPTTSPSPSSNTLNRCDIDEITVVDIQQTTIKVQDNEDKIKDECGCELQVKKMMILDF